MPVYIGRLWQRRYFIYNEARSKLLGNLRQNVLGYAWLILDPILLGLVYYTIFGVILHTSRGIENFIGFLVIGLFFFQHTLRCLNGGASCVRNNKAMIKAFSFPRASIPISTMMREVLNLVPIIVAMIAIILIAPPQEPFTWRWILLLPVLALMVVFNFGMAMFAARLTTIFPDFQQVVKYLGRFWRYGSAVFFSVDKFEGHPVFMTVTEYNPLFNFIDMARDSLLYATTPALSSWLIAGGWALVAVVIGFVFFWQGEESYARD